MNKSMETVDLLVVGGGVNGAGIAADAARRGLSVLLCEQDDLASATSSSSSKMIHGGIRYLEHYDFGLVAKSLREREVLLKAAPHIIWPMRFRLPHLPSLRPAWMIRIGLFLYDHLARRATLPGSKGLRFGPDSPLKPEIKKGFEYSDCWVDDARLVVLNAMAAREHGATILTRTRCVRAVRQGDLWQAVLHDQAHDTKTEIQARAMVNAAGPWVQSFIEDSLHQTPPKHIRLVKGSHIVVPRLFEGTQCYILQNDDGRVIFAIPYEGMFTLIGTTDQEIFCCPEDAAIDDTERSYLIGVVNRYFKKQVAVSDIVWSYSGVRPLLDDESDNPSAVTREYYLAFEHDDGAPALLSVFGGKITTYRELSRTAVDMLEALFPDLPESSTATALLPGGGFETQAILRAEIEERCPWLPSDVAQRYVRSYGTLVWRFLGDKSALSDMGRDFGAGLYEAEVAYLRSEEWAVTAEDILWRRTKRGLFMSDAEKAGLAQWLASQAAM
ncbi:glycerol-3-phosphate dehydrogenase [Iodidimonas gelatinilytica]|uniref:Glycerol-3-phosphate dehydrogenase n=1 Tax=Iodidimonas gelatinilytica TaxID=1236966 RepID=A0A5A7N5G1_9PROT|nr:glycerol-3-phosphate dehydrogenase [Iodidimonas gelatinilytica]GER02236.1 glycerol-3-phosphate dehydrogenase [Iodidimonas gelatinilytica]